MSVKSHGLGQAKPSQGQACHGGFGLVQALRRPKPTKARQNITTHSFTKSHPDPAHWCPSAIRVSTQTSLHICVYAYILSFEVQCEGAFWCPKQFSVFKTPVKYCSHTIIISVLPRVSILLCARRSATSRFPTICVETFDGNMIGGIYLRHGRPIAVPHSHGAITCNTWHSFVAQQCLACWLVHTQVLHYNEFRKAANDYNLIL